MLRPMRMGMLLLALGGAFWAGERHERKASSGSGARDDTAMIKAIIESANKPANDTTAALRDCNDAMYMWLRALEMRTGDWDDSHPLPGFRYLNPEGEVVTYHVPPPRKRTGSLHIGPDTVRREAGYIDR